NEFNFDAYKAIITDPSFGQSLAFTFYIAIASTVLSIALAIFISMGIRKAFKGKRTTLFAFQFPLPIPHLVSGIMILFLFSQSGLLSRLLTLVGAIDTPADFPQIVYSKNGIGIILALMWKFVPYVGVAVVGILQTTGMAYEEAAISLGANAWQRFVYVLLPVIMPSITTSAILIFAYAFSSYEIPFLLGAVFPKTLSIVAYQKFMDINLAMRPQAMAMSSVITVIVLAIVLIYKKLASKVRY
ncbi:MAG: ABC transporter permease subunit, partial [Clostridia bacterium]